MGRGSGAAGECVKTIKGFGPLDAVISVARSHLRHHGPVSGSILKGLSPSRWVKSRPGNGN